MSFILNALRKSEQERQTSQAGTLENKILLKPGKINKKTSGWLICLVILNVFFMAYFIWSFVNKENTEIAKEKNILPEKQLKDNKELSPLAIDKVAEKHQQTSIAEQVNKLQTITKEVLSKRKELTPKVKQNRQQQKLKSEPIIKDLPLVESKIFIASNKADLPDNNTNVNDPPFLSELAYEFRRTVPDIEINVFVYSEKKENRFIMINMNKYLPGQQIDTDMTLKEIRINSIVVEYKNRVFQIKRK